MTNLMMLTVDYKSKQSNETEINAEFVVIAEEIVTLPINEPSLFPYFYFSQ